MLKEDVLTTVWCVGIRDDCGGDEMSKVCAATGDGGDAAEKNFCCDVSAINWGRGRRWGKKDEEGEKRC